MLVRANLWKYEINVWSFATYKALQVLYERVSYPRLFEKFLEASEDERKSALDRIPHDLILLSIDLLYLPFL